MRKTISAGLAEFSHIEVLFSFHQVDPAKIVAGARHPRNNTQWPAVGIFAQRGKNRPNRLGSTICSLVRVDGRAAAGLGARADASILVEEAAAQVSSGVICGSPFCIARR